MLARFAVLAVCLLPFSFAQTFFNLTALATVSNISVLQCWQLNNPFTISTDPGTAGSASLQLGGLANSTYSVLPAQFNGGLHLAPHPQYVTS